MKRTENPLLDLIAPGYPKVWSLNGNLVMSVFIPAIDGEVPAKERPQARVVTGKNGKPFPQFYTPKKTKTWEEHVANTARAQVLTAPVVGDDDFLLPVQDCRVLANLRFNMKKPASYPKSVVHDVRKPDLDNLVKAILDGLVQGRILEDDNAITDMFVSKRYADATHPLGVEVELTCILV